MKARLAFLSALFVLAGACSQEDSHSETVKRSEKLWHLDCDGVSGRFTVVLNDLPIFIDQPIRGADLTWAVSNGSNDLRVQIEGMKLDNIFRVIEEDTRTGEIVVLHEYYIKPEKNEKIAFEFSWQASIDVEWPWTKASSIETFDDDDRDEIYAVIQHLHSALKACDRQEYYRLRRLVYESQAAFSGVSVSQIMELEAEECLSLSKKGFKPHITPISELHFVPFERVVYVSGTMPSDDLTLGSVVRFDLGSGRYVTYGPFVFAKIQGKWSIIK